MELTKEVAVQMALQTASMVAQIEGTLMACEDGVERMRLENAKSALDSLFDFYRKAAQ